MLWRFLKCESGASAMEYGLIATMLSLAIVTGIAVATDAIQFLFSDSNSKLIEAIGSSG